MKTLKKILTALSGSGAALALSATTAAAQLTNPVIGDLGEDDVQATEGTLFATYFGNLWGGIMAVGGILVLVFFIWGAVEWIASGGDKGKVENARNRITQSIVGLIILIGSYIILGFISELFFGDSFNILEPDLPSTL